MKAIAIRVETHAAYRTLATAEEAARAAGKAILMLAAPFIGLAFVVVLPFAGIAALAWIGARAFAARYPRAARAVRNVALFAVAPFVGLVYAAALPFVGVGAIAYVALKRK